MRMVIGMVGAKGSGKDTCAAVLVKELGFKRVAFADKLYKEAADAYGVSVAFLGNRDTKETDLAALSLERCTNLHFVEVALETAVTSKPVRASALSVLSGNGYLPHVSRRRARQALKAARSPRWVLQLWGTEYRRKSKYGWDSYWLDVIRALVNAEPEANFVITDVRFNNEGDYVELELGGVLYRTRRPALEAREAAERAAKGRAAHPSETEMLNRKVSVELVNREGMLDELREQLLKAVHTVPLKKVA